MNSPQFYIYNAPISSKEKQPQPAVKLQKIGVRQVPQELKKKVKLLNKFRNQIDQQLLNDGHEKTPSYFQNSFIPSCDAPLVFVKKFVKVEDVVIFRLSNGTVQLNFKSSCVLLYKSTEGTDMLTQFKMQN
jgi:hypothetical protein